MTRVKLVYIDGLIAEVEAKGHTGYAEHGKDIVCAAVSALIQGAVLGLKEVAKVKLQMGKPKDGYLHFRLLEHNRESYAILQTMKLAVADISREYPSYIKMEETKNVY